MSYLRDGVLVLLMLSIIFTTLFTMGDAIFEDGRARGACEGFGGTIQNAHGGGWYCLGSDGYVIENLDTR